MATHHAKLFLLASLIPARWPPVTWVHLPEGCSVSVIITQTLTDHWSLITSQSPLASGLWPAVDNYGSPMCGPSFLLQSVLYYTLLHYTLAWSPPQGVGDTTPILAQCQFSFWWFTLVWCLCETLASAAALFSTPGSVRKAISEQLYIEVHVWVRFISGEQLERVAAHKRQFAISSWVMWEVRRPAC